jgi:hypothetical protein
MKKMLALVAIVIGCALIAASSGLAQSGGVAIEGAVPAEDLPATTRTTAGDLTTSATVIDFPTANALGGRQVYARYNARNADGETKALQAQMIQLRQLTQRLRQATDEAAKADLTKQLEAAVGKYFDEDLKNREGQLTELEERVSKLRAQLDRRRKAKGEITQLQTKVLVNEADGLGFSGAPLEGRYAPNDAFRPYVAEPIEYSNRQLGQPVTGVQTTTTEIHALPVRNAPVIPAPTPLNAPR